MTISSGHPKHRKNVEVELKCMEGSALLLHGRRAILPHAVAEPASCVYAEPIPGLWTCRRLPLLASHKSMAHPSSVPIQNRHSNSNIDIAIVTFVPEEARIALAGYLKCSILMNIPPLVAVVALHPAVHLKALTQCRLHTLDDIESCF